jgi:predicted O-methyltransferase YrrM
MSGAGVGPPGGFDAAWEAAELVDGWLTRAQGERLWRAVGAMREGGRIVEIGSFRGRSAIVLASGAPEGSAVVCIDPHLGSDRGPQELRADHALGEQDHAAFRGNLARAGVAGRVHHVRERSQAAHGAVPGPIDVLFVDGAHRYGPALDDLRSWGAKVAPGGRLLVHDAFSSIGVTAALLRTIVFDHSWRYAGRDGSLAEWVRAPRAGPGQVAEQLLQLGWFARNLAVKALLLARLRPAARLLGHRDGPWPY